jgi:hypothetical protein
MELLGDDAMHQLPESRLPVAEARKRDAYSLIEDSV